MKFLFLLFALFSVAFSFRYSWAWVHANGKIVETDRAHPLNVTQIGTGHYCFNWAGNPYAFDTYAAVTVTLQTGGLANPVPGYALANTGWGDLCNPYGGASVRTFAQNGAPYDAPFSMIVNSYTN